MKFFKKDTGGIAVITGLVLLICLGFAGFAIDVGVWYTEKRKLQLAADAGAIGGILALNAKGQSSIVPEATYDINLNDCTTSNDCTIVAINNPPATGPSAGNNKAVEVILSQPADLYFSKLFLLNPPTLIARAVAGQEDSNNCLTSLSGSGIGLNVKGGATLNALTCGVYVNSTDPNAINVTGGGVVNTDFVKVVGGVNTSGGGTINSSNGITQGVVPLGDPYTALEVSSGGCDFTNYQLNNNAATINPGVYCGGIKLVSTAVLNMSPGVYVLRGDFDASAQSTINGSGVTIIMTKKQTGPGYGTVKFNAGMVANLSAPTMGTWTDILFYGDRAASSITHKLTGGSGQVLSGTAYFPTTSLEYSGQATAGGNPCFRIIAWDVTLTGGTALGLSCQATGGPISLLE